MFETSHSLAIHIGGRPRLWSWPVKIVARNNRVLLIVLMMIYVFDTADFQALGISLQSIKLEFHLSDTELGFLTGIAFSFFYAAMGLPIARWADRGNRVTIISLAAGICSVMVAACGFAMNFAQLLLIRVGVAVGEAGCLPPSHSLIADYFPRGDRARAMSLYMLGAPASVVFGFFAAGWLNQIYGWRVMFMVLAAPGFCLALLARLFLREPRLQTNGDEVAPAPETPSPDVRRPPLLKAIAALYGDATYRQILMSYSVMIFLGSGGAQWQAVFFARTFGMKTGEIGTWFAIVSGLGSLLGIYLGALWTSRWAKNNETLQLKAMALVYCIFTFVHAGMYLSSNYILSFGLMGLGAVATGSILGPLYGIIQTLVPEGMRALSVAIMFLLSNLVGMGFGPLAAGFMSDALRSIAGQDSLRYSLTLLCPGFLWVAWHFWRASQTAIRDRRFSDGQLAVSGIAEA